jgi:hypothetical protein
MPRPPATDTRPSGNLEGSAQPDNVAVHRALREVHGSYLDVTFAPHSFTVCELNLAEEVNLA